MLRLFLLLLLGLILFPAQAHQIRPAIVDVYFASNGNYRITIETNLEALIAGVGAKHDDTDDSPQAADYDRLRSLPAAELKTQFSQFKEKLRAGISLDFADQPGQFNLKEVVIPEVGDIRKSRLSKVIYTGSVPDNQVGASWQYSAAFGNSVVRFAVEGKTQQIQHWLEEGKRSPVFEFSKPIVEKSGAEIAWDYLVLGFEHIVPKGVDHILFVLGLFLLSLHWRPLLWQVTVFTVAHSITLGLSIYGYISLPASIVEPLIALSIAYVGIENILTRKPHVWRTVIVFLFGLLHGMGFASVLTDLGLPESQFVTALITFNVGVEFGQLSVIAAAFLLIWPLKLTGEVYRRFIVIPGSLAIALVGLYWTWERLVG